MHRIWSQQFKKYVCPLDPRQALSQALEFAVSEALPALPKLDETRK